MVHPHEIRHLAVEEPVVAGHDVDERGRETVARRVVEVGKSFVMFGRSDDQPVRISGRERHVAEPTPVVVHHPRAVRALVARPPRTPGSRARRRRRPRVVGPGDEREGVDLPVWMRDGRADERAAVLEDEDVLDLRVGRAAPRCARPRGRRPGGRPRPRSSPASRRGRGSRGRPPRARPGSDTKPDAAASAPSTSIGSPGANGGHRFSNARTVYGSGASSPPTQNGHGDGPVPSGARFGRSWRSATIATHSRVSGSSRSSLT